MISRALTALLPALLLLLGCGPDPAPSDDVASDADGSVEAEGDAFPDAPVDAADEAGDVAEADGAGDDGVEDAADAEAPPTGWDGDVPAVETMTEAEHIDSCLRSRACSEGIVPQTATCTAAYAHVNGRDTGFVLAAVARCVNAAGPDCDAVRACVTHGEPRTPCTPLATPDRCEGTLLRQCSRASAADFVFDCADLGLGCFLDDDHRARCALGRCDPDTFRWSCADPRLLVSCDLGVIVLARCDAAGLACVEFPDGALCAGGGAACTDASDPRRCDGDRIRGCIAGRSADIDCDAVVPGWTCGDRSGDAGCVAAGSECTALPLFGSDIDESCDGEALRTCLDGRVETLSCAERGLGPCVQDCASGEYCAARCTPGG